jgi:hypothetical protein
MEVSPLTRPVPVPPGRAGRLPAETLHTPAPPARVVPGAYRRLSRYSTHTVASGLMTPSSRA